ncbi:MAG: hypothetical protein K1Y36_24440 [Blastocatellia bacterium]|nr:hypothetical protein [Blastocatellia bacterium]
MSNHKQGALRIGVAAQRLRFSKITIRRWIYSGRLQSVKYKGENRVPLSEITRIMEEVNQAQIVIYARVSSPDCRAELDGQLVMLRDWVARERPGKTFIEVTEISDWSDFDRVKLNKLFYRLRDHKVSEIIVLNRGVLIEHDQPAITKAFVALFEMYIESFGAFLRFIQDEAGS